MSLFIFYITFLFKKIRNTYLVSLLYKNYMLKFLYNKGVEI